MAKKIYLAAKMQALAVAVARRDPGTPLTPVALAQHPEAVEMGACEHHAISALTCLTKAGMLERVHAPVGRARYGYVLPHAQRVSAAKESLPAPAPAIPADVKVTVIKETGSLRVEFKGIRIEIGVAE